MTGGRLLILGWHNVAPTWLWGGSVEGMRAQLQWIRRSLRVVDLAAAVDALSAGRRLPARAVALTFDDGYRDNLDLLVPMLEELGLPATFFLCPDLLSTGEVPWWERLAWAFAGPPDGAERRWRGLVVDRPGLDRAGTSRLLSRVLGTMDDETRTAAAEELAALLRPGVPAPPSPLMGWEGAAELVRRGFAVGSHTCRHAILANEAAAAQVDDLVRSRSTLRERLGAPVDLLAYPNGTARDWDAGTVAAAAEAGYRAAVTTVRGWNAPGAPLLALRRFVMRPELGVWGLGVLARPGAEAGLVAARRLVGA